MSPHTKKRAITITITTAAIGSALLVAGAWGMPSAKSVASVIDHHWVRADTFALKSQRDSLNAIARAAEQRHYLDSISLVLKVCIRHPGDCP